MARKTRKRTRKVRKARKTLKRARKTHKPFKKRTPRRKGKKIFYGSADLTKTHNGKVYKIINKSIETVNGVQNKIYTFNLEELNNFIMDMYPNTILFGKKIRGPGYNPYKVIVEFFGLIGPILVYTSNDWNLFFLKFCQDYPNDNTKEEIQKLWITNGWNKSYEDGYISYIKDAEKILIHDNGSFKVYKILNDNWVFHNSNGPAKKEYFIKGKVHIEEWYKDNMYHNLTGPAYKIYYQNGIKDTEIWYKDDKFHNESGPAIKMYYKNGNIKEEHWYQENIMCQYNSNMIGSIKYYESSVINEEYFCKKIDKDHKTWTTIRYYDHYSPESKKPENKDKKFWYSYEDSNESLKSIKYNEYPELGLFKNRLS